MLGQGAQQVSHLQAVRGRRGAGVSQLLLRETLAVLRGQRQVQAMPLRVRQLLHWAGEIPYPLKLVFVGFLVLSFFCSFLHFCLSFYFFASVT